MKPHLNRVLNDKAFRYRVEKWFWVANVPAALFMYVFYRSLWESVSILYLALVSIYALVLTAGGAEQAAEAAVEATKSADG
jgi:hypothetical protein